ncbi:hypothetical protein [Streptomyces sp. NEAU-L66]|uniref:hypothetical protein n=1 Tax=Streptomyces sp. NEAU-L66 TaxID=3390812 RepID=UPI0039C6ED84
MVTSGQPPGVPHPPPRGDHDVQLGFSDGSWGTLFGPDTEECAKFFPHTLGKRDPIP